MSGSKISLELLPIQIAIETQNKQMAISTLIPIPLHRINSTPIAFIRSSLSLLFLGLDIQVDLMECFMASDISVLGEGFGEVAVLAEVEVGAGGAAETDA